MKITWIINKKYKIMEATYEISISGEGSRDEILLALLQICMNIQEDNMPLDGATWEDLILITNIKEV